ncbi:MAG: cadmium-translocating P-type ATPase [Ruminococcus sp.]|nr:cadmium-translocating P-type ATPase [Ruminococcus sp.]
MKYTFILQNLNCANCAGKIENKIINTDGFENVSFNFATKKLNFSTNKSNPLSEIQAICDSIEDGVTVVDLMALKSKKYTFILQNLNCANCAGKIENKIINTDGFENVSFNFATKKLNFSTNKSNPLSEIQAICDSIEDGVTVVDSTNSNEATHSHNHSEHCDDCNDHEHSKHTSKNKISSSAILIIIAIICGVCAIASEWLLPQGNYSHIIQAVFSLATILTSGLDTFKRGLKNIIKFKFDETALMTIAVVAAFCLGEFVEAAMVTLLFAVGELIEDKAVNASRRDIEKLAQIRPDSATVIRNGKEYITNAENVAIGSIIIVKPHERVPLDGKIIKGKTTLDNSALTGESLPIDAGEGSEVLSGAINGNSLIEIQTMKEFGESTATRILRLVEDAAAQKGKNEKLISRFASIYTPIVIVISILIAVVPTIILGDFTVWLYRALTCLVASCPCSIVISVPLAYYSGIGASSKIGVLIKGGKYLEALAKADSFVFDKTGTLTTGKLSVNKIEAFGNMSVNDVLALAAACEKHSVHPIATAIKQKANNLKLPELINYNENAGYGTSAEYKGKKVECGGYKILSSEEKQLIKSDSTVFLKYDNKLVGAISVSDTLRIESKQVISELKNLGVKNTVMLTGDSAQTAKNVSGELGLSDFKADLLPADKLSEFKKIKDKSKSACFIGDGINDAPVLSASDCGIAMGLGSEAAIEAADAVLASGTLEQLPTAIKLARKVMNTVRTNIAFSLIVKATVIILAAFGIAHMWMSVIADTGVSVLCVLYAARLLEMKK